MSDPSISTMNQNPNETELNKNFQSRNANNQLNKVSHTLLCLVAGLWEGKCVAFPGVYFCSILGHGAESTILIVDSYSFECSTFMAGRESSENVHAVFIC